MKKDIDVDLKELSQQALIALRDLGRDNLRSLEFQVQSSRSFLVKIEEEMLSRANKQR